MSTAPTGTILAQQKDRIREVINSSIETFLPVLSPVWRNTIVSSQGVVPASQLGRDMKIIKVFMGSMSGVFDQGGPKGDFPIYGDDTIGSNGAVGNRITLQDIARTFPNALEGPSAAVNRLGVPMRSMVANIAGTLSELETDDLDSLIGEVWAPKLEGFGRLIAHTLCNYWYLNQNNYYQLAAISSSGLTQTWNTPTGVYSLTFTPDNLAVDRFAVGMRVDIFSSNGATRRNTNVSRFPLYVTAVDPLKCTVTIKSPPGAVHGLAAPIDITGSVVATDIVVYANSKGSSAFPSSASAFSGIAGVNSWLKGGSGGDDNYLLGAERDTNLSVDVTVHPEFKSMTKSMGGAAMTEHEMRKILRRWMAAKKVFGRTIDTLVASDGVWLAYEATKIGREVIDRTGRLSSVNNEGSQEGFTFTIDGQTIKGMTDSYVESGTIYGFKRGGNNWKRMIPPQKNAKRFDKVPPFIPFEFVGRHLTGTDSDRIPILQVSNSQTLVTEAFQMPGYLRMQLVPDQPDGLKITNVAEDRTYSDN